MATKTRQSLPSTTKNPKSGASGVATTTPGTTIATNNGPISYTRDGKPIYVGDWVKVPNVINYLKVIKLDSTSPPERDILTCWGGPGANPATKANGHAGWHSVYADETVYQYTAKQTKLLRERT